FLDRLGELCRVRRRKSTGSDRFANVRDQWSAIHIADDTPGRGGALFDSGAAAAGENNHGGAGGVVNGEGNKKLPLNREFFFDQHSFHGKLSHFHRQHARRVSANIIGAFGESDPADAGASGGPSLNFDHQFTVLVPLGEFLRCGYGVSSGGHSAATRNLESVGGK